MDRRTFLKFLGTAAALGCAAELVPGNRVWSFPSKIVIPPRPWEKRSQVGSIHGIRIPSRWIVVDTFEITDFGVLMPIVPVVPEPRILSANFADDTIQIGDIISIGPSPTSPYPDGPS